MQYPSCLVSTANASPAQERPLDTVFALNRLSAMARTPPKQPGEIAPSRIEACHPIARCCEYEPEDSQRTLTSIPVQGVWVVRSTTHVLVSDIIHGNQRIRQDQ